MKTSIIGRKVGMTQIYDENNVLVPVTVIEAGPCPVVQIKTEEKDGYSAIQIGFGKKKAKNTAKAEKTRFEKAGVEPQRSLAEVRGSTEGDAIGDLLTVEIFQDTPKVDVISTTKGRGFQGVVKRWNMDGQPATHGHMMHRRPGSIGMRQTPGHVFKGKKMPGHYGQDKRTVQNLAVVKVIPEKNLILLKGSVPGMNGTEVIVRKAIKQKKSA